ncbi:MAG TPA: hypothetical protein VF772_16455 [Terriglobales bacterium]
MNTKAKGNRAEYRSIALLESAGCLYPQQASLGCWDIIGIGPTDVVLEQCKTPNWPGAVEMEAIKNFQCPPLCQKDYS